MLKKRGRVEVVDVQFVTGYNHDEDDLRMGGSPVLGHFAIVAADEVPKFVREIKKHIQKLGKSGKIKQIIQRPAGTRRMSEIKRGQSKIDWFKRYLNKEDNWTLVDA